MLTRSRQLYQRRIAPWRSTFSSSLCLRLASSLPDTTTTRTSSGYRTIPTSTKVDEEIWDWYPRTFYNVKLGEILHSRYKIVSKLGFGTSATVWLARDMHSAGSVSEMEYVALKVCMSGFPSVEREKAAFRHLSDTKLVAPKEVQRCLDSFILTSSDGNVINECLVLEPLGYDLIKLKWILQDYDLVAIRMFAREMLRSLAFLHEEAHLIHCDLKHDNFLMRFSTQNYFRALEQDEQVNPMARKIDGDCVIYQANQENLLVPDLSEFMGTVLCDFGEARPGNKTYLDDVQPFPYRAPEVILEIPFTYSLDIWNAGVMLWHLFESEHLFHPYTRAYGDEVESDAVHLSQMISRLGHPPPDLVQRTSNPDVLKLNFFDENWRWVLPDPIYPDRTLEAREKKLHGEEKVEFLRFIRRFLRWRPEDRASAAELLRDPFLAR